MPEDTRTCPYCGHEVLINDIFCGTCGKPLKDKGTSNKAFESDKKTSSIDEGTKQINTPQDHAQSISKLQVVIQEVEKTNSFENELPIKDNFISNEKDTASSDNLAICPNCNQLIEKDSKFCKNCGYKLTQLEENGKVQEQEVNVENTNLVHCPECGKLISKKATACPNCGHPFPQNKEQNVSQAASGTSGIGFWGVVLAIIVAILIISFC